MLSIASSGVADTISTLRESLRKLAGSQTVRATLSRESRRESEGEKANVGRITTDVEATAEGVSIHATVAEIARRREEKGSVNLDPEDVLSALHHAPVLLKELDEAVVTSDAQTTRNGATVRLLQLKLRSRIDEEDRKKVKEESRTMKLWLDPAGTPLASEIVEILKLRVLLLSFSLDARTAMTFAVLGDRLLVVSETHGNSASGLGQKTRETRTTTLKVK
jgi:hypothetical protein